MAKVRHRPFPLQNHSVTLKFTVHIFMKLADPTHTAKIKPSKRSNGESHQADFACVGFLFGYSLPKPKAGKYPCSEQVLNERFLKEGD